MRKTVAGYAEGDAADELARTLRIDSSVLCRSVMAAPWGFGIAGREAGSFHMVLEGGGWLDVERAGDPVELRAGDVAVLPTGSPHWMRDSIGSIAPPLTSILEAYDVIDGELRFGGDDGPVTEIVCGVFTLEDAHRAAWIDRLPPVVVSRRRAGEDGWRAGLMAALRAEARSPTKGGSLIVNRSLEALVGDAIRSALSGSLGDGAAGTAALADARIGRALARIHGDLERPWTVRALADEAVMSRSAFSDRFRAVVGDAPMRYLTSTRLARSARLLRSTDATVGDVARSVGYRSEEAFSRAFKARFGEPPSLFRARGATGARPGDQRGVSRDIVAGST